MHAPALALLAAGAAAAAQPPHIVFFLIDDLGWAELGYQRAEATKEVQTPEIDALVADGVRLDRHYVHKFCSPTRCAIQSGRAPIHVNAINAAPEVHNPDDPIAGYAGIPRNMTGIAEVLRRAGYKTHMFGKWDVGMATAEHTPAGRGYDSGLIYFHHANDCWKFTAGECGNTSVVDHWEFGDGIPFPGRPATGSVNVPKCSFKEQSPGGRCVYEDAVFEEGVTAVISAHDVSSPLFLFWATRTVHGSLQPPDEEIAKFSFIDVQKRQMYHAMVAWIDGAIGRVVAGLRAKAMYNDTLVVFSSDNGGPLPAGNNYPHKGGKFSNWEGGIRVAAFASGGLLPPAARGTVQTGLVAGWDWYATFAGLAGIDPTDERAARAGLPPVDSVDLWPLLSGAATASPRARLEIGSNAGGDIHGKDCGAAACGRTKGSVLVGGVILPPHKIIVGGGHGIGGVLNMAGWPGPQSPNSSAADPDYDAMVETCGLTPDTGCLFDVWADPGEHNNLAAAQPDLFHRLLAELNDANATVFNPHRGSSADPAACAQALRAPADGGYGGFWGPFVSDPVACPAACAAACPRAQYPTSDACLKCTRADASVAANCKPKERKAYCNPTAD